VEHVLLHCPIYIASPLKHFGPFQLRMLQEFFDPSFGLSIEFMEETKEETRVCVKLRRTREPG